eukprot:maker-scaffold177_size283923-snap-gene-1.30 protein:Tk02064 transcript:maker-scaffold177_size283923-snap-gene-1.30-mRNA-1 annotation:"thioredoxin-dependent peroxide mitochondrial"
MASSLKVIADISKFKDEYLELAVPCLVHGQSEEFRLKDFSNLYQVILFYPHDFNAIVKNEILELISKEQDFKDQECQILTCSTDSIQVHCAWQKTDGPNEEDQLGNVPNIRMLGDVAQRLCRSLDALNEAIGSAHHAVYVIHPNGNVIHKEVLELPGTFNFDYLLDLLKTRDDLVDPVSGPDSLQANLPNGSLSQSDPITTSIQTDNREVHFIEQSSSEAKETSQSQVVSSPLEEKKGCCCGSTCSIL